MSSVKGTHWNNILAASGTTAEHALTCSRVILSLTLLRVHVVASHSASLLIWLLFLTYTSKYRR